MFKKLTVILLSLLLVLSFAACGKDKDKDNSSSGSSSGTSSVSSDPTQDFEDEWGENDGLTQEELDEIEKLWNDGVNNGNGGAEITDDPSASSGNSSVSQSSNTSSGASSATSSVASSATSSTGSSVASSGDTSSDDIEGNLNASVAGKDEVNALF